MRSQFILGVAALALVVTACTTAPAGLTPEDEAAIRAIWDQWGEAFVGFEWDLIAELVTDDVLFMPPNGCPPRIIPYDQ